MAATGTPAPQRPTRTVRGGARSPGGGRRRPARACRPAAPAGRGADRGLGRPPVRHARARPRPLRRRVHAADPQRGPWVILAHPDMVRESSPATRTSSRRARPTRSCGRRSASTPCSLLDGERHLRQRRLLLPPFHGERMQRYGDARARDRRARGRDAGPGAALRARARGCRRDARGHHARGLRRARGRAARPPARAPAGDARALHRARQMLARWPRRAPTARRAARAPAASAPVDELLSTRSPRRRDRADLAEREDVLSLLVAGPRTRTAAPMGDDELRDELMTLLWPGTRRPPPRSLGDRAPRAPPATRGGACARRPRRRRRRLRDAVSRRRCGCGRSLPLVVRRVHAPVDRRRGATCPRASTAVPCIHLVHRRPDVYPEPDAFRPERFLERPAGTYTWFPFGGGTRRCLGAAFALFEMRTVLRVVAAQAELRPARAGARARRPPLDHARPRPRGRGRGRLARPGAALAQPVLHRQRRARRGERGRCELGRGQHGDRHVALGARSSRGSSAPSRRARRATA